ncbi:hypothetical protein TNCV_1789171 [Trichonephila clavipes]|nr:hypothetical protein TNCV_1789171 [Trichonephila clavipes]
MIVYGIKPRLRALGSLVVRASDSRPEGWVRCPMPPHTLRVHTEYVLVKSVGPKILWAESRGRELEYISLPFNSMPKFWSWRLVVSPSIVPSGISSS